MGFHDAILSVPPYLDFAPCEAICCLESHEQYPCVTVRLSSAPNFDHFRICPPDWSDDAFTSPSLSCSAASGRCPLATIPNIRCPPSIRLETSDRRRREANCSIIYPGGSAILLAGNGSLCSDTHSHRSSVSHVAIDFRQLVSNFGQSSQRELLRGVYSTLATAFLADA